MHPKTRVSSFPELKGEVFKKAREDAGLSELELANALCLSAKHIKHIEENNLAIFFSPAHRYQVAKKVAAHLSLSDENAFGINKSICLENHQPTESSPNEIDEELSAKGLKFDTTKVSAEICSPPKQVKQKIFPIARAKELFYILLMIGFGFLAITFGENFGKLKRESAIATAHTPIETIAQAENLAAQAPLENQNIPLIETRLNPCEYKKDELYSYVSKVPDKPANYVYLVAKEAGDICVIDSENTVSNVNLNSGVTKTVNGKAPFIIASKDLSKFDVFYQGAKIHSSILNNRQIKLIPSNY